jgi:hypothetical protein
MSDDAESAEVVADASGESDAAVAHIPTFEEGVEEQLQAEASLWKSVFVAMAIAVPVCIIIWVSMVAIAVGGNSGVSWGLWIGMGAIIGVLAGAFFGGLFAFLTNSHLLDETDRHTAAAKHEHVLGHH